MQNQQSGRGIATFYLFFFFTSGPLPRQQGKSTYLKDKGEIKWQFLDNALFTCLLWPTKFVFYDQDTPLV